jgi:UDP-glucose 4-epimerase
MSKNNSTINSKNSQRILITGGCGFIGANLVSYLINKGINYIRILDNLSTGIKENLEEALRAMGKIILEKKYNQIIYKFENIFNKTIQNDIVIDLIIGDIRSSEMCLKTTENIDAVVHLAAHAGVIPSIKDPFHDFEVNVRGTLNLIYAAVENKVDKFIFASSNAPLGEQDPPLSEKKVPKPLSPYGASKLACEGYCFAFNNSYGLKTIILRFSNVYGPYSLHKNSVIAKFMKDALLKRNLTIYGDGKQTRDFIYVDDLCQAIDIILDKQEAVNSKNSTKVIWGDVLHLGTGKETSIINLAKYIKELFDDNIKISFEPERKGEIKRNYSDISKAEKLIGFESKYGIESGLKTIFKWFHNKKKLNTKNNITKLK